MYKEALDAVQKVGMIDICKTQQLYYVQGYQSDTNDLDQQMEADSCALGAMFALGYNAMMSQRNPKPDESLVGLFEDPKKHWNWAKELTRTCRTFANLGKFGSVSSEIFFKNDTFHFDNDEDFEYNNNEMESLAQ